MKTQLAIDLANYLTTHHIDMFEQTTFEDGDFFESEQLVEVVGSDVVPTVIVISEAAVIIEWSIILDVLAPELRWAVLEFLNALNNDVSAFSSVLSPIDSEDDLCEVTFRYYEPSSAVGGAQQIMFTYTFMAGYIETVLYPELLAIIQEDFVE